MTTRSGFLLLLVIVVLNGCGSQPASSPVTAPPAADLTGNWQIQSSAVSSGTSPAGVLLLGSLKSSGAQVTGVFRFTNLGNPTNCGLNEVVNLAGSIDSARNLTLTSSALANGSLLKLQLLVPAIPTDIANGTIQVSGSACGLATAAAIGSEFDPVTGTFAGPLTPGTLGNPTSGTGGTASITLSESSTPAADGQFPVTGTLIYSFGSCTGSIALTGTQSGAGLVLNSAMIPAGSLQAPVSLLGVSPPIASQITVAALGFTPAACSTDPLTFATYTGTLARS